MDVDVAISQVLIPDPVVDVFPGVDIPSAALTSTGEAYFWGEVTHVLGDGSTYMSLAAPTQETFFTSPVTMVGVGLRFACAVSDGLLYCWGGDFLAHGVLGSLVGGTVGNFFAEPTLLDTSGLPTGISIDDPDEMCIRVFSVLVVKDGAL